MPGKSRHSITIDDIPQKENLFMISLIPKLYYDGLRTSKQIADHFGQHIRHGHFLIHECKMLGWMDDEGLTEEGIRVAECRLEEERKLLIKKAVLKTPIIQCLIRKYGQNIITNPDKEKIAGFLFMDIGLAPSTAKRRSSSIIAWMKFLSDSANQSPKNADDRC